MFNNKFKKYKKVYFIDCENVGFELPFPIDKNAYYYYFCNNNAKIDFNSVNTLMNHRNIGLYTHTASKQKKNSLPGIKTLRKHYIRMQKAAAQKHFRI